MQSLLFWLSLVCFSQAQNVYDTIVADTALSGLDAAINTATADVLSDLGRTFTVLAPTDPNDFTGADLGFHVIDGQIVRSTDLENGQLIPSDATLSTSDSFIRVVIDGTDVYFCSKNCAMVVQANIEATNGVIHKIDSVLTPAGNLNIAELATNSADLSTLRTLVGLSRAVLTSVSDETLELTLFAPTNDAFSAIPAKWALCLQDPESEAALTEILLYHTVSGIVPSFVLTSGDVATLSGETVDIVVNNIVTVNGAQVTTANIFGNNGIVHIINSVLLPSTYTQTWFTDNCATVWDFVQSSPDLDTLQSAIDAANLETLLDEIPRGVSTKFTVFAPSDEALADFTGVPDLAFHVLGRGKVFSSNLKNEDTISNEGSFIHVFIDEPASSLNDYWFCSSNCVQPVSVDNTRLNGVIHIIDGVLVPADDLTITDIIVASSSHATLEAALRLTDLTGTFDGDATFTVFAPTDAAFAASFTEDELSCLTDGDHNEALADILSTHVVSSVVPSFLLSSGEVQTIVTGRSVTVVVSSTAVTVEGTTVTTANVFANNGVIHIVDAVIRPDTYSADWFNMECSGASSVVLGLFSLLVFLSALLL